MIVELHFTSQGVPDFDTLYKVEAELKLAGYSPLVFRTGFLYIEDVTERDVTYLTLRYGGTGAHLMVLDFNDQGRLVEVECDVV